MTTATPPRWTEYLPVAELQPAARNAKDHDRGALAASVGEFGFVEPVVLDERTGRLVAGHGRAEYLQELEAAGGGPPPDGVVVGDDGRWLVLVTRGWTSRDNAHAEAAGIALNRVGERGGWRADVLNEALDALWGTDLAAATGWTADELDDLIASTSGGLQLAEQPTDAAHAEHTGRGDPAVPREVQGLREVGLMFHAEHHREYLEHLAKLKRAWGQDAAPLVVLRALREAADRA